MSTPRAFAESATSPQMAELSAYMSAARARALPADVAEQAKHHLLDTLASIISGSRLAPGAAAQRYLGMYAGKGSATIPGTALSAPPLEAAVANGVMAHADETDDSNNAGRWHPGCAVVPAALAAAEELGGDGTALLNAVTLGYDVGTRIILAMFGENAKASYDVSVSVATHSIAGTFGAAAAACCVAGLDAQQMRWALGYAAQQSSGTRAWQRDTDHIEKGFVFGGMPARNGLTSALLVKAGWTGVDDIFTGADNFFATYAPKAEPERLVEKLGTRYDIALTDIKKWTVGSPIQAPLDGLEAIRKKHPFEANEVKRVTIRLAPPVAAIVDNRDIPDICLQHMVAVMLLDKTVSFHAAHDDARMHEPTALRERQKVDLVRDDELTKFLPVRVTLVEVELSDGTRLSERVTAVRGTPRNPMTRAEVIDKARDLVAPVLGRDTSGRLIDTIYAIEQVADVRSLRPLLRGG
ncbi:MmgE/PrpD family protein [Rhodoplanes sp. Z2-YC6860]|uniref:MmgE/PrpD family protein n=1 Tax=Rhodoplanes sp. Z2-YC6860 TaxID=674703 RepID=UPI001F37F0FA|nr:MmgE/PrpD family protein [Rhodoplanes sp. Z2-YC6860]